MSIQNINASDLQASETPFVAYLGTNHPNNKQSVHSLPFLGINLNPAPILKMREEIAQEVGKQLIGYPEAHITVISPPELEVLFPKNSIEALSHWSIEHKIQSLPFEVLGLGRATNFPAHTSKTLETYFLVVASPAIQDFRKKLFLQFSIQKKVPEAPYEAHITVGFTRRDLHAQDGVSKGPKTLISEWSAPA
jgi:hypothetical protein